MQAKAIVVATGLAVSLSGWARATEAPLTVAPGEVDHRSVVRGSCPTFHWSEVEAAEGYELAILRFERDGERGRGERTRELYRVRLPGRVQGWTPTVERCLEPGARYAWAVRALAGDQAGPWSEARIFEIAGEPTIAEVEQALSVLRRWLDRDDPAVSDPPDQLGGVDPAPPEALPADRPPTAREDAGGFTSEHLLGGPSNPHQRPAPAAPAVAPPPGVASMTMDNQLHLGSATHVFKEGELLLWEDGAAAITSLGRDALGQNTTGINDTAVGALALHANTDGSNNTAVGASAMHEMIDGTDNTAVGYEALGSSLSGVRNTAVGASALHATMGSGNTALGYDAMGENITGLANTAVGALALHEGTTGSGNTAVGIEALGRTTGSNNVAVGAFAMHDNASGADNSALGRRSLRVNVNGAENVGVGVDALFGNTSGSRNTGVGPGAGLNATTGNDNIYVGSGAEGVAAEGNTIRIGGTTVGTGAGQQSRVFINGIRGVSVANATTVLIDANTGQLGTVSSSRRHKEDIRDMDDASRRLLELRPVTFRFKEAPLETGRAERERPLEYGLIAEEVADSFPELVVYDEQGQPQTVKYHLLSTLLLNELQRLDQQSRDLEERLREQNKDLERLRRKGARR